jgi:glutamine amidotransferase
MSYIAIIDYGMGNLHSIAKALEHVSGSLSVRVSDVPETILGAARIVFPGVGAIRDCMAELERSGLGRVVHNAARTRPMLGICLGMQALLEFSEENEGTRCLGVIPGKVCRFPAGLRDVASGELLKIPHMGWNQVHQMSGHPLWRDVPQDSRFYFVHSYHAVLEEKEYISGVTNYGPEFVSAVTRDNVFAVQFHPEKSQRVGLKLLENFTRWNGES